MDENELAEILYQAYWAPTAALTGRTIAAYDGSAEWVSVARKAIEYLAGLPAMDRDRGVYLASVERARIDAIANKLDTLHDELLLGYFQPRTPPTGSGST